MGGCTIGRRMAASMYVTEPYPQGADGLRDLFDFCEQWDLTATVEACPSIHNPGGCLHIRILPNGKQWGDYEDHTTEIGARNHPGDNA